MEQISRRPGGRTADVTRRINEAVLALLVEGGIDACSFSNLAAKAGIERSTLYRRCPDRWLAIIDAIIDLADRETPVLTTGSFRRDLRHLLGRLAVILSSPLGPPLISVAAALRAGAAPDQFDRFWDSRRKQLEPLFEAAVAREELPEDVDLENLFAIAAGPIHFRLFIIGRPVDELWIDELVEMACDRHGLPPRQAAAEDEKPH